MKWNLTKTSYGELRTENNRESVFAGLCLITE